MLKSKVKVKLLDDKAKIPSRAHDTDTGYDLTFIGVDKIVGDVIFFKTGIAVQPPDGFYFEVVPRSSISKLPLMLTNSMGVIDQGYANEILVPIRVLHDRQGRELGNQTLPDGVVKIFGVAPQSMRALSDLILKERPTMCQMILRKRLDCQFDLTESFDETARGLGGFGSTDKK